PGRERGGCASAYPARLPGCLTSSGAKGFASAPVRNGYDDRCRLEPARPVLTALYCTTSTGTQHRTVIPKHPTAARTTHFTFAAVVGVRTNDNAQTNTSESSTKVMPIWAIRIFR